MTNSVKASSYGPNLGHPSFCEQSRRPTGRRAGRALGRSDDLGRPVALLSEERPIGRSRYRRMLNRVGGFTSRSAYALAGGTTR
jgi:hypothetical protein